MKIEAVPIDKVIIKDRGRKDYGEVGSLADSISRLGLMHPLVLEDNFRTKSR